MYTFSSTLCNSLKPYTLLYFILVYILYNFNSKINNFLLNFKKIALMLFYPDCTSTPGGNFIKKTITVLSVNVYKIPHSDIHCF